MLRVALLISALTVLSAAAAAAPYQAPRTPDGRPDLQGVWTNTTFTPLQRPKAFADLHATEAEAAKFIADAKDRLAGKPPPPAPGDPPPEPDVGATESEWYEGLEGLLRLDGRLRSSLITEPRDGRLPYNLFGRRLVADSLVRDDTAMDGPEDRLSDERCLMPHSSVVGPPMLPSAQNAHYQIVQTPDFFAIHTEMIHDVRMVRMGGGRAAGEPRWNGDSVGRWEGETLVVETTSQHPLTVQRFVGPGVLLLTPAAKVVERFTRTGPAEIRYAFEVEDPAVYSRPWRGEFVFRATSERVFEYACHEGNYALPNILRGARRKEADAAQAKGKAGPP